MNTVGQILAGLYVGTLIGLGTYKLNELIEEYIDSPAFDRHVRKAERVVLGTERRVAPIVSKARRSAKTYFRSVRRSWAPVDSTVN